VGGNAVINGEKEKKEELGREGDIQKKSKSNHELA